MTTGLRAMPVLAATDVGATARFFGRLAGFEPAGFWRDAEGRESFGILRLGTVTLGLRRVAERPAGGGWAAYVFLDEVAPLAELACALGIPAEGPVERPYGCIEVEVADPDGNVICFAQDLRPGPEGPGL